MKNYLVFGATGSIGSAIVSQLLAGGNAVTAVVRRFHEVNEDGATDKLAALGARVFLIDTVANEFDVGELFDRFERNSEVLDGIIYAVGHCPPRGFLEAVSTPLSRMPVDKYLGEIRLHQMGVLNVYQSGLQYLKKGGSLAFMSSAITRHKGKFPPFLQAHYHASVISAQDWLIDGMRHDPEVMQRNIKVHRLAPGAVDTPFHAGPGLKPPKMVSTTEVANEVLLALASDVHVDKELL